MKISSKTYLSLTVSLLLACSDNNSDASDSQKMLLPLKNANFETLGRRGIPDWSASQHAGVNGYEIQQTDAHANTGQYSVEIKQIAPQVYGMIRQRVDLSNLGELKDSHLHFQAAIKIDGLIGSGAQFGVNFSDAREAIIKPERSPSLTGTADWQTWEFDAKIPDGAHSFFYGIMLTSSGTIWIDDVQVELIKAH